MPKFTINTAYTYSVHILRYSLTCALCGVASYVACGRRDFGIAHKKKRDSVRVTMFTLSLVAVWRVSRPCWLTSIALLGASPATSVYR